MADEAINPQDGEKEQEVTVDEKQPAVDQTETAESQEEIERREQEETEKKPWYKKRFDKLTRRYYEAEERAENERLLREQHEAELKRLREPEKPGPRETQKPKRADFGDYEDEKYAEALVDWKIEQREARAKQSEEERSAERQRQEDAKRAGERQKTFIEKRDALIGDGEKKFKEDFHRTVQSIPASILTQQMAEILVDSQFGSDIAYHLGKNLQEAEHISKLNPMAMAREIGKIEARIGTAGPKETKATPPIAPIKGRASASSEIDPAKDPDKWIEARNRGEI